MELTQTKTKEKLPLVNDDDKVRVWQDSQTIDSSSERKKNNSQEQNGTENSNEHQPVLESEPGTTESQARPQETSKKTKRKKAKSKKAELGDMFRNGQEGEFVASDLNITCWETAWASGHKKCQFPRVLALLSAT